MTELVEIIKLVGGPSAVAALGWWLRSKFSDASTANIAMLTKHEKEDQRRHAENLVRFAKINMKLGIKDANSSNGGP